MSFDFKEYAVLNNSFYKSYHFKGLESLNGIIGEGFVLTKLLQKENIKINCPHCKQEISDAWICKMESIIGVRYAYLCSNCQKLIGIASQKNTGRFLIPPGSRNIEAISQN